MFLKYRVCLIQEASSALARSMCRIYSIEMEFSILRFLVFRKLFVFLFKNPFVFGCNIVGISGIPKKYIIC